MKRKTQKASFERARAQKLCVHLSLCEQRGSQTGEGLQEGPGPLPAGDNARNYHTRKGNIHILTQFIVLKFTNDVEW